MSEKAKRAFKALYSCIDEENTGFFEDFEKGYNQGQADALKTLGDRKVIQISFAAYQGCGLVALCDDGTLWYNDRPHDSNNTCWLPINLPTEGKR